MDLRKIKTLLQLMNENDLNEMELEEEGMKIVLRKGDQHPSQQVISMPQVPMPMPQVPVVDPGAAVAGQQAAAAQDPGLAEITAPTVGTFYRAPNPDSPAFVEVGAKVVAGESVVCIVEAMKVMNEVKAEISGTIKEILVDNGEPVEYGQPLFLVKSDEV